MDKVRTQDDGRRASPLGYMILRELSFPGPRIISVVKNTWLLVGLRGGRGDNPLDSWLPGSNKG
jgi:hypothetical protein